MKIKRFIAFLLAIACLFSLAACGKDVEKDTVDDNTTQTETPDMLHLHGLPFSSVPPENPGFSPILHIQYGHGHTLPHGLECSRSLLTV